MISQSLKMIHFMVVIGLVLTSVVELANGLNLVAYLSQHGLHGEIHFNQRADLMMQVEAHLETTLEYPDQSWSWGIHQMPIDYSVAHPRERCEETRVGDRIVDLDDELGYLIFPGNETTVWETELKLTGEKGLWGKSLVLSNLETGARICATIITIDDNVEHIAEARFHTTIAGSIYFRWLAAPNIGHADTLIYTDLFHVKEIAPKLGYRPYTEHIWKLYVTDIFQGESNRPEEDCNVLQLVFDPKSQGLGSSIGDIDKRAGKLKVAKNAKLQHVQTLKHDAELALLPSDLNGPQRRLFVVIFDVKHPDEFIACAKIRDIKPRIVRSIINDKGLKGEITITQRSRFEPTWLNFSMSTARNDDQRNIEYARDVASFKITELPPISDSLDENRCLSGGSVFNPLSIDLTKTPPPGFGTQEQYAIGDLTGKLQSRSKSYPHKFIIPDASSELSGIYWDVFLPLEEQHSIVHRGFGIQKFNRTTPDNITEAPWACGALALYEKNRLYQVPMFTAQVLFRYPIVGRVLFRQPKEEPWRDTSILFEYLIHADGSTQNNSNSHRWAIHAEPPGKDFYNWSMRCVSSGHVYNPYKVTFNDKEPEEYCSSANPDMCRTGDLWNRLGSIAIAGSKIDAGKLSRRIFTDHNIPLVGPNNIMGKSLVIFDDFGPVARGERLACSIIGGHYRRKVVANDWYSNGVPLTVQGKLEMVQQSEYDITNVEVELKGLVATSGYHVHMTPVEGDLQFPCEESTLYGHYNPRNVDPRNSPRPTNGTTDQYEMGDLSGKFGTLDGLKRYTASYNDTMLPLFGYESILGRSIVIHKKEKNLRWACSTLERGYSPSEAREIRAIASFHHPAGFAYGYLRFTQLIYSDGSKSDTAIEVKLRHPGVNDRNVTRNHNWNIFVNPIGVDATVKGTDTRCVAGGYIWNPYYTQLADPLNGDLYRRECGPDNPLRCYVGDVSARVGTIDIGVRRKVFSDPNFPLEGVVQAVGRSIVIFGPEMSGEKFACANIEPDHNIVKYVNLQKPPRFVVAQFLDDVRNVMGLPEWMLNIDSRKTKTLHGDACIQLYIHFKGPKAHQLDVDFSRLISTGRLDSPTISIPGFVNQKRKTKLSYKSCGVRDPNEKKPRKTLLSLSSGGRVFDSSIVLTMGIFATAKILML